MPRTSRTTAPRTPFALILAGMAALAALGWAGEALARGGDTAEQRERLKAQFAEARAAKAEDRAAGTGGFSLFGLFSDDEMAEAEAPAPAGTIDSPAQ